jgi:ethanolamine utilization microcompartment shell protein EutL
VTDDEEPDLQHELPDAAHDELRRALRWAIRHIRNLEHGNAPGAGSTDQTGDTIDVIPLTATAVGRMARRTPGKPRTAMVDDPYAITLGVAAILATAAITLAAWWMSRR